LSAGVGAAAPANGDRCGPDGHCAVDPRPLVPNSRPLLERKRGKIEVEGRRPAFGSAEDDRARVEPKLGELEPEHVRVAVVIRMQAKALARSRDWGQPANREVAAAPEIDADHLIPVVHNRRLHLFWTVFKAEAGAQQDTKSEQPRTKAILTTAWGRSPNWSKSRGEARAFNVPNDQSDSSVSSRNILSPGGYSNARRRFDV
jgi:Neuraminidase-like domain